MFLGCGFDLVAGEFWGFVFVEDFDFYGGGVGVDAAVEWGRVGFSGGVYADSGQNFFLALYLSMNNFCLEHN